jgi:integrase
MTRHNSTGIAPPGKVQKPYPDFPLFAHANGQWAKKIRGVLCYFGKSENGHEAALANYNRQKEELHAGKKHREHKEKGGASIKTLCNDFLAAKFALKTSGELSPRTYYDYELITDIIVDHFGKGRDVADIGPDDFLELRPKLAERLGPVSLGNTINRIRIVFKFAYDAGLIDAPVRFGPGFKRPSAKTLRLSKAAHEAEHGKKLFTAEEIKRMIAAAGVHLRAMIMLGINCGLGNSDCGNLRKANVDLDRGWLDYPRPKTGIPRRCPLWPETVQALGESLAQRPEPKDEVDAGLVFVTKYGMSWTKDSNDNPITKETRKLLDELGIRGKQKGFYTLRHCCETIGGGAKDQVAVDFIMGHVDPSMGAVYRQDVEDERLQDVVNHVHAWLFAPSKKGKPVQPAKLKPDANDASRLPIFSA